ncbi:hypothetical protein RI049_13230 [Cedecea neteri]|uniref:hypothetical protein n=1 Tax=Cedecea neteri TaxID=158822 RepID=UPI002AA6959D|nr:hypothetical protein [Cedecea neteri]WPU21057.1 hypothetical protein RI049_13230 [Cedecea neteri]
MADFIFLIGPGGAGKSTVGAFLAARLGYACADLDDAFCTHVSTVFILSSGFLATDIRPDIVEQNRDRVQRAGLSVLLLPSRDYHEALSCIVARQLKRGFGLKRESEIAKFDQRFSQYLCLGDVQIFSMDAPEVIAAHLANVLSGQ